MNWHYDEEWPACQTRLESRHAYVEIAAVSSDGKPVYEITGGRHGQRPTYRAIVPRCECALQSCPKCVGKREPQLKVGDGALRRSPGRADRCGNSRTHDRDGHCAGRTKWRPGDALALAKAALKTWGRAR